MMNGLVSNELNDYWNQSNLTHLKLERVTLNDIRQFIDPQQCVDINGWIGSELATTEIDQETFNNLVFIDIPKTRPFAVGNRSLRNVTKKILSQYSTIDELFQLNDWFGRVGELYKTFDYEEFGYLLLRAPIYRTEKQQTPEGSLYLEGGNHRSLALSLKMNVDGFVYKPVKVVVLLQPEYVRGQ